MEVIVFEKESFNKLIDELTVRIIQNVERHYHDKEWIGEDEAKELLGIRGKGRTCLQRLRDTLAIEFSQFGRIIRYSRSSILQFLEKHRMSLDRI
ncbi:MAG: helix-turn-helix domain-containing protein [Flavobacteriales bacterium]|nr:helix-turn-helix domain-containing protein [Flavobacteriales bacterium]